MSEAAVSGDLGDGIELVERLGHLPDEAMIYADRPWSRSARRGSGEDQNQLV